MRIGRDVQSGLASGQVPGTPTLSIDGVVHPGRIPPSHLDESAGAITAAHSRARRDRTRRYRSCMGPLGARARTRRICARHVQHHCRLGRSRPGDPLRRRPHQVVRARRRDARGEFGARIHQVLGELGVDVKTKDEPFGVPMTTPFAQDLPHAFCDPRIARSRGYRADRAGCWTDRTRCPGSSAAGSTTRPAWSTCSDTAWASGRPCLQAARRVAAQGVGAHAGPAQRARRPGPGTAQPGVAARSAGVAP